MTASPDDGANVRFRDLLIPEPVDPFMHPNEARRRLRELLAAIRDMPGDRRQTIMALTGVINFIRALPDMRGLEGPLIPLIFALEEATEGKKHPLFKPSAPDAGLPRSRSREGHSRQDVRAFSAVLVTVLNRQPPPMKMSIRKAADHVAHLLDGLGYLTDRKWPPSSHAVRQWRDSAMAGGHDPIARQYQKWMASIEKLEQPLEITVEQLENEVIPNAMSEWRKNLN